MQALRRTMRDNPAAAALVGLMIAFMVLQAMVTGLSRSVMAAEWQDGSGVICGTAQAEQSESQADRPTFPGTMPDDCPCASLCHLAAHGLTALPANGAAATQALNLAWIRTCYAVQPRHFMVQFHRHTEARAPPKIS